MTLQVFFTVFAIYLAILYTIGRLSSKNSLSTTYFDGNRKSPWYLVAFGMISSGISAVSLVSIPGNVFNDHLYFFQFILGTVAGYFIIAFGLLPVFHRMKLISLYQYLQIRFGTITYKTGTLFFLISQSFGAALRLLLSVKILQHTFLDQLGMHHSITILLILALIWLYTHRSGIKTIVYTDALQSLLLITVIVISIFTIKQKLGLSLPGLTETIVHHPLAKVFDWNIKSGSFFFKQFISGLLITVALVGLDQSMMQKTLTVEKMNDARKNVISFSLLIAFAQTLFLLLGILLVVFVSENNIPVQTLHGKVSNTDSVFPLIAMHHMGSMGFLAFMVAVMASTFATIDSCIAAMTTALSYDLMDIQNKSEVDKKKIKIQAMLLVNLCLFIIVSLFWNSKEAIIETIFKLAGYTYGPLLGLYTLGFFTKIQLREKWVPLVCILAPIVTYVLCEWLQIYLGFDTGFINILINALITALLLWKIKK